MTKYVSTADIKCDKLDDKLIKDHYKLVNKLKNMYQYVGNQKPSVYADPTTKIEHDQRHLLSQHPSHTFYQNMCKLSN